MAARDVYKGLSGKIERRKEREELYTVGAKFLGNFIKEQNEDMAQANENFQKGNENVMQQIINYTDAQEDAEWFPELKDKARTENLSMGDYLVNMSAEAKESELRTQLGTRADQYFVSQWARDLAEGQRDELLRIFNAGYNKAVSTDWDQAGFDDFRILHDGRADNVGSALWNIIKSPFVDKEPEVTGDMLAAHLENSVYGRDSTAMIGYRKALRDGFGLNDALDLANYIQNSEEGVGYRRPVREEPLKEEKDVGGLGPAWIFKVFTPGVETPRETTRFGQFQTIDGEERWVGNPEAQAMWDKGHTIHMEQREIERNGEIFMIEERVIKNQNGDFLESIGSTNRWVGQSSATPQLYARTINEAERTASQGALTRAIQNTFSVGEEEVYPQHKIDDVVNAYLGITQMGGEQTVSEATQNRMRNHMYSRVYSTQKQLQDHGFTEQEASNLSAIMMSEEIKSGIDRKDGTLDQGGWFDDLTYNAENIFMSTERGFNPLHILNAYATAESSKSPISLNAESVARLFESGSVGLNPGSEEDRDEYENIRRNQINQGSYIPSLFEAVDAASYNQNNAQVIDEIMRKSSENVEYQNAVEEIIGDLGLISRR